ncbi:topoisomerase II-associated protein PAT1-domain-containing protein [Fennellomyces sp. T-0311]|nr:topoisomerase II-associated protein PAT1-domain-containing protein [Fennellomyces sp. T-0311]
MSDSFFGFNTSMPPLSEGELQKLESQEDAAERSKHRDQDDDLEVYDFDALKGELDAPDDNGDNDNLGDLLIEQGDDLNDETFGDAPVGTRQDYDFFSNTEKFNSTISEEEAFFAKRLPREDQGMNRKSSGNSWGMSDRSGAGAIGSRPTNADYRGQAGNQFKSSPVRNVSSIWGGFGGSVPSSMDRGFGSFSGNTGSLSPFMRQQNLQQAPQGPPGLSPSSSMGQQQGRGQPMRLEDLEAELHRLSPGTGYRHDHMLNDDMDHRKKAMQLQEIEAAILASGSNPGETMGNQLAFQQLQQQVYQEHALRAMGFGTKDPAQMLAMQQQQQQQQELAADREAKLRANQRKSQYDGLMTQHDKDFIKRIQISQLASSDPYSDDFYYQVYSSLRQRAGLPVWSASAENAGKNNRGRKEENGMQRFHQQLQRVVNNAKRHPRQAQVSLEGALGKITSLTVRNPRQVLQVSEKKASAASGSHEGTKQDPKQTAHVPTETDRRRILKIVENLYLVVLELEQMRRQGPPKPKQGHEDEHKDALEAWNAKYADQTQKLWTSLRLLDQTDGTPLIVSILSVAKGAKLIPRIVRHLSSDQNLTMLTVIIAHFSRLTVCRHVIYPMSMVANAEEAKKQKFVSFDDVELFINMAAPPLLSLISEAPLQVINGLVKLFIEKNDIVAVARTKPGLAFLTMLLSRAEILKQGGAAVHNVPAPSPEDLSQWQQEYNALFGLLQIHYASIFPSFYYLVPIQPTMSAMQLSLSVDDMYVWQFLAAMAVGASMEQQHILVTEVRERVMENIVLAHSNRFPAAQAQHRLSNVNLFLHALGLDSSQVTLPR